MADHRNDTSVDENELSRQEKLPLQDEVAHYAKRVCASIRSARARAAAEAEIFDHIQNAMYEEALHGVSPERSFPGICASFGDPSILRQQLARVHNRVPPGFWRALCMFFLRLGTAALLSGIIWGFTFIGGDSLCWYHLIPSVLILVGLRPMWAMCRILHRLRFQSLIKRIVRKTDCEIRHRPSFLQTVWGGGSAEILLRIREKLVCIRFLSWRRGEGLRFVDETCILRICHRSGVGIIDRRPGQFNFSKTAFIGHTSLHPAAFSFLCPPLDNNGYSIEQLLVIDHFPQELSAVDGNAARELIAGDHVFGFTVHSRKSCLKYVIECVDNIPKGNS